MDDAGSSDIVARRQQIARAKEDRFREEREVWTLYYKRVGGRWFPRTEEEFYRERQTRALESIANSLKNKRR